MKLVNWQNLFKISKIKKRRSPVLHSHVIFLTLNSFSFFVGNFFFHFVIHVSSLTVTLLCSQGFCLCYQVTQSVSHFAMSKTCWSNKEKNNICTSMFVFDFLNMAAEIFLGTTNRLVKPVCFVSIWGLYSKNSGVKEWKICLGFF